MRSGHLAFAAWAFVGIAHRKSTVAWRGVACRVSCLGFSGTTYPGNPKPSTTGALNQNRDFKAKGGFSKHPTLKNVLLLPSYPAKRNSACHLITGKYRGSHGLNMGFARARENRIFLSHIGIYGFYGLNMVRIS